jgi:acyl-CoA oxidase
MQIQVPIITHPVHQRRLLPHLATCYAMLFVGQRCKQQYSRSLTSGGELPSDPETWQLSTTFKIGASEHARDTLRTCTECCGGQGFISRNYLQQMKFMCDAAPTSEGDNTLLLQGIAKQLLGVYRRDFPKSLVAEAGYYVYLTAKEEVVNHWSSLKKAVNFFGAGNSLRDPAFLLRAFEIREQRLLRTLDLRLNKAMTLAAGGVETVIGSFVGLAAGRAKPLETGDAEEDEAHRLEFKHRQFDAWSVCMTHAVALGRAHVELVAMRMFHVHLLKAARTKACSPETLALLQRLCGLYGLCIIERDPWFLTEGLLTPVQMKLARLEVDALCLELAREEKDLFRLLDALRVDDVALQRTIAVPNWIDINYRLPTAGSAE